MDRNNFNLFNLFAVFLLLITFIINNYKKIKTLLEKDNWITQ